MGARASTVPRPLERDIQKTIMQWLATQQDCFAERLNTGAIVFPGTATTKRRVLRSGSMTGGPDIRVSVRRIIPQVKGFSVDGEIVYGRPLFLAHSLALEVKRPGGKQSDSQRVWQAAHEKVQGLYRVVTSLEEAIAAVNEARGLPSVGASRGAPGGGR